MFGILVLALILTVGGTPQDATNPATLLSPLVRAMMPPSTKEGIDLSAVERDEVLELSDTLYASAKKRLKKVTPRTEPEIYDALNAEWLNHINGFLNKYQEKPDTVRKAMIGDALHFYVMKQSENRNIKETWDTPSSLELMRFYLRFASGLRYTGAGHTLLATYASDPNKTAL